MVVTKIGRLLHSLYLKFGYYTDRWIFGPVGALDIVRCTLDSLV
jgi:hypothetical protein